MYDDETTRTHDGDGNGGHGADCRRRRNSRQARHRRRCWAGANTFTGTQTITSTDAGAAQGPVLELSQQRRPAAADDIGAILFQGEDSGGGLENYARIRGGCRRPDGRQRDSKLTVRTVVAGTLAERVAVGGRMWMAGATSGDPGAGRSTRLRFRSTASMAPHQWITSKSANNGDCWH